MPLCLYVIAVYYVKPKWTPKRNQSFPSSREKGQLLHARVKNLLFDIVLLTELLSYLSLDIVAVCVRFEIRQEYGKDFSGLLQPQAKLDCVCGGGG